MAIFFSFRHNQMYKYNLPKFDLESILSFCSNGWYKHVKAVRVPRELMWFDQFTDDVVSFLKVEILIQIFFSIR